MPDDGPETRVCGYWNCGNRFRPRKRWQRYCSLRCKRENERRLRAMGGNLDPAVLEEALALREHVFDMIEKAPQLERIYRKALRRG